MQSFSMLLNRTTKVVLLLLLLFRSASSSSSSATSTTTQASMFWNNFKNTSNIPSLPPHTPQFIVKEQVLNLTGSSGLYNLPIIEIWDTAATPVVGAPVLVALYAHKTSYLQQQNLSAMGTISLLGATPQTTPTRLPDLPRVGWAWSYGAVATTITWLDCCSVTGDESGYFFQPPPSSPSSPTVTLSEWQRWNPNGTIKGRDAFSEHNFTIEWDSTYGYVINAITYLKINAAASPKRIEFLNFLNPRKMQPWKDDLLCGGFSPPSNETHIWPPRGIMTTWSNDTQGESWIGFSENILAGAELGWYNMPFSNSSSNSSGCGGGPCGAIISVVEPNSSLPLYSPSISYGAFASDNITFSQLTCPTWGDQHQMIIMPTVPDADGYYEVSPSFSIRYLPPEGAEYVLAHTTLTHNGSFPIPPPSNMPLDRWNSSVMIRLGVVETFEDEPIVLSSSSLRALAQIWSNPDYTLVSGAGVGYNGSATAWMLPFANTTQVLQPYWNSNSVPLVPLNASTQYVYQAYVKMVVQSADDVPPLSSTSPPRHHQLEVQSNCSTPCLPQYNYSAWLWLGLYEADDFNNNIAPGPTYGRLLTYNSSILTSFSCTKNSTTVEEERRQEENEKEEAGIASEWSLLSIPFTAPSWVSYADIRVFAVANYINASENSSSSSSNYILIDDFYFAPVPT